MLRNKKILLGVTGGVAAYKSIDLVRRLKDEEASVTVIMTDASKRFVTPLSFEVASQNKVYSDLFEDPMAHITLSRDADAMVIAPATANIISKVANGIADDLLSTCIISFKGKIIIAPSMNWRMYENPIFQENLSRLVKYGITQVGPEKGRLACGEEGAGRMAEVNEIIEAIKSSLSKKDFFKKSIIVTAGPTREYLDPVRFISNRSSGKMGYAIARACIRRGAEVTLISGPASLSEPQGLRKFIKVETTEEMRSAVLADIDNADVLIMAAAPADFRPEAKKEMKADKSDSLTLKLKNTPDILAEIGQRKKKPLTVGFAAETGNRPERAREKLIKKGADIIVFNDVTSKGAGFDIDTNRITIIEREGKASFPLMTKDEASDKILDAVSKRLDGR